MEITDLLTSERVMPALRAPSKKQALQELSRRAAEITGKQSTFPLGVCKFFQTEVGERKRAAIFLQRQFHLLAGNPTFLAALGAHLIPLSSLH